MLKIQHCVDEEWQMGHGIVDHRKQKEYSPARQVFQHYIQEYAGESPTEFNSISEVSDFKNAFILAWFGQISWHERHL